MIVFFACSAQASSRYFFTEQVYPEKSYDAYLGVDAGYYSLDLSSPYSTLFKEEFLAFNVFIGYKIRNLFSFELGYFWTDKSSQELYLSTGESFLGRTSPGEYTHSGSLKLKNSYFSIFYNLFDYYGFSPFFGAGIGGSRQSISFTHIPDENSAIASDLDRLHGRSKIYYKTMLGANFQFWKRSGIRLMYSYDMIDGIRLRSSPDSLDSKPFANSSFYSIGFYWLFQA